MDEASWTFVLVLPKDWTACLDAGGIVALLPADCQKGKTKENRWGAVAGKRKKESKNLPGSEDKEKENEEGDPA